MSGKCWYALIILNFFLLNNVHLSPPPPFQCYMVVQNGHTYQTKLLGGRGDWRVTY